MTETEIAKTLKKLIAGCVTLARKRGASDPTIYFEGNSGLAVFDGPVHGDNDRVRWDAMLFRIDWPRGEDCVTPDVGAW